MDCALPALLLLVLVLASATAGAEATKPAATALEQVCGSLGGWYVTPSLCTSALCSASTKADPCRAARDAPAVAALAARLVARNATAAQRSIQAAAAAATNATTSSASGAEEAVRSCLRLYPGAVPALHWAAAAVSAGRYRGATEVLQMAQYVAAGCEGIVPGSSAALPPENGRFGDG